MTLVQPLKSMIRSFFRSFGYEIYKTAHVRNDLPYEAFRLVANYAPWNADERFLETYRTIKPYTFVDIYRCFELWALVEQTKKLDGAIIEIGVWRGGTGALIAKKAELCNINRTVYLCDTFTGVPKASNRDSSYKGGEHANTSPRIVQEVLDTLGLSNAKILPGIFPDESAQFVEDKEFRFCHIDVDVYQSAKDIVDWIWDKIVIGGLVVYDDFGFEYLDGITKFVEEQRGCADRIIIHNLNGHAVVVKIK